MTLRDQIYDFAAVIADLAKHPKQGGFGLNPNVGVQIVATVLNSNFQNKQLGMMGMSGMPEAEEEPSNG